MTKKHNNPSPLGGTNPPTRDVNAVARVEMALKLRATRMPYDAIAKQCGYSDASSCRKAVMRELDRCVIRAVDALRTEELHSLDVLELEVWKIFSDKDRKSSQLFAIDRILAIKDRRSKLLGLDTLQEEADVRNMVVVRELPPGYLTGPAPVEAQS